MNKDTVGLHTENTLITAVNAIFDKWNCTFEERIVILGVSETEYTFISDSKNEIYLKDDVLKRISYILNIYEALGMLFSNPLNRNGFLKINNSSVRFEGLSPLEHIVKYGTAESLNDVFMYLERV